MITTSILLQSLAAVLAQLKIYKGYQIPNNRSCSANFQQRFDILNLYSLYKSRALMKLYFTNRDYYGFLQFTSNVHYTGSQRKNNRVQEKKELDVTTSDIWLLASLSLFLFPCYSFRAYLPYKIQHIIHLMRLWFAAKKFTKPKSYFSWWFLTLGQVFYSLTKN